MTVIYDEHDADLEYLRERTVGIVGYNSLGRSFAHNLHDSGIRVMLGSDGTPPEAFEGEDWPLLSVAELSRQTNLLILTLPDEAMVDIYMQAISPNLMREQALVFTSAYNIAFGFIEPPPFVDVGLLAPRVSGSTMRQRYLAGQGFLSYVAVWQDASRHAWDLVLGVAGATGSLRTGAVEVSITQEAEMSLFIQQAVIPVFHHVMTTAAQLLIQSGYPPEVAMSDLYLAGKFNDFMQQTARKGMIPTLEASSLTAQYGSISRLDRFNELKLERLMEVTLEEIRRGDFVKEWTREYLDGHPRLNKLFRHHADQEMWEWEQQTLDFLNDKTSSDR